MFLDECHLLHGDLTGYVWGQCQIRIEVPITTKKDRQTYLGALHYQSKEFHVQSHASGDRKSTVKFTKYLQNKYKSRKIILICDGKSYHNYQEVRDFLLKINGDK
ncbi:transposase [Microcoleus sp. AR_TQ3_B6]|uniref:transposase n=1 Tax=Microcoleus sp. AR_TQ3_B6 TaxID=3055284 RepID=UPI002FD76CF1